MSAAGATAEKSLATGRLALAPLALDQAPALHALINDWDIVRMLAVVPWPVALKDVEDYLGAKHGADSEERAFCVMAGGAPIGVGSVKQPGTSHPPRKMPRLGYWIGRRYWGKGYGTEAVAALVAHAFEHFPQADMIGAGVFEDNPASRRVLEKLGFERRGGYPLHCRARGAEVLVEDMILTRARWAASRERA